MMCMELVAEPTVLPSGQYSVSYRDSCLSSEPWFLPELREELESPIDSTVMCLLSASS
jgi:hypothetical protein